VNIILKGSSSEIKKMITKKAEELDLKLQNHPKFVNKKPSKLDAIIVYFVSVNVKLKKMMTINELSKVFDVSIPTLKKTCKLITLEINL